MSKNARNGDVLNGWPLSYAHTNSMMMNIETRFSLMRTFTAVTQFWINYTQIMIMNSKNSKTVFFSYTTIQHSFEHQISKIQNICFVLYLNISKCNWNFLSFLDKHFTLYLSGIKWMKRNTSTNRLISKTKISISFFQIDVGCTVEVSSMWNNKLH